jgi:seryl-tRNA synthetase
MVHEPAVTTAVSFTDVFRDEVIGAGLLTAGTVDGLYGRSDTYEQVATAVQDMVTRLGVDEEADHVRYPPVLPRVAFEQTGYLSSFPNLMGSVHTFAGDDRGHAELLGVAESGGEWAQSLAPTEVMLCSAACHHVYPTCTGELPEGGRRFQVSSWCFRHEPSRDLTRMQAFRMVERVYVGDASAAVEFRERWVARGRDAFVGLGLDIDIVTANDPFFGRAGRLLARSQRDEALKLEFVMRFDESVPSVALASSNLHQDHFGHSFGISTPSGGVAHSTCFGFGVDRLVLALFRRHGLDPALWQADVREQLWP